MNRPYEGSIWIWCLSCLRFSAFFFLIFFMHAFQRRQTALFTTIHYYSCTIRYCSQAPHPLYLEKNIKNGSHSIIHIFKNYIVTVFSVFSKISCIQTDPKPYLYFFAINAFVTTLERCQVVYRKS